MHMHHDINTHMHYKREREIKGRLLRDGLFIATEMFSGNRNALLIKCSYKWIKSIICSQLHLMFINVGDVLLLLT